MTPWKNGWKIIKRIKHAKRAVFYVYVIFWEQSGQAGVENGAMRTTYLVRYTSECTILQSNFQKKLPQAARGHWPPNQNPADVPGFIVLQSVDPVISIIPSAVDFLSHSKLSLQTGPGNFSLFSFYHSVYTAHWRLRDCAPINLLLTHDIVIGMQWLQPISRYCLCPNSLFSCQVDDNDLSIRRCN